MLKRVKDTHKKCKQANQKYVGKHNAGQKNSEGIFFTHTPKARGDNSHNYDLFCKYSVKTGIKDTVSEPSAKSLLKRLGIRKATKNASADIPEPKKLAMSMSLTNPRILLRKVKIPTTPAALVTRSFSFMKNLDTVSGLV